MYNKEMIDRIADAVVLAGPDEGKVLIPEETPDGHCGFRSLSDQVRCLMEIEIGRRYSKNCFRRTGEKL